MTPQAQLKDIVRTYGLRHCELRGRDTNEKLLHAVAAVKLREYSANVAERECDCLQCKPMLLGIEWGDKHRMVLAIHRRPAGAQ